VFISGHLDTHSDEQAGRNVSKLIQTNNLPRLALVYNMLSVESGAAMILRDLQLAFRQMGRSRGYALAVILTLTLGVGINTAVFSMVDGFLMRSLPYPQADRVGALILHSQGISPKSGAFVAEDDDSHTGETWQVMKEGATAVTLAAWGGSNGVNLQTSAADGRAVRYVQARRVSADYFSVLGIPLYLGRAFSADEDRPNGPSVAILSYGLWQSTFRADPQVVGKAAQLKGKSYTVIGVLPRNAVTPSNADLFTPLQPATTGECGGNNCGIIMRLKPGATWQQANAQLGSLKLPGSADQGSLKNSSYWFYAQPLSRYLSGDMRPKLVVLMLAVSFILLIACANLAGLALVRFVQRTHEVGTRLALGATRFDILRQFWIENLLLAVCGAAASLGLASLILEALGGFLPESMIPVGGLTIDTRVLGFTLAASLLTSVLFGALPALRARRVDLRSFIATGSRTVAGSRSRTRQWLIGAEVALTVVLLVAAGLLVRTLIHLETLPPGFDATNVMTAKVSLDDARYHDAAAFHTLLGKSVEATRQIPGVQDAAVGLSVPYERGLNDGIIIVDGKHAGRRDGSSLAYITPGYFSTLRIPIFAGRAFAENDVAASQPVAIVNSAFAKKFFDESSPLGRHFQTGETGGAALTIVGVAANVAKRPGMNGDSPLSNEPVFYLPATQTPQALVNIAHIWFQPSWIVRTSGRNQGLAGAMQQALAEADPNLPFSGFYSMDQILAEQLQQQRIEVVLLTTLAGLALLLSAIGIYALVSSLVVQRTREIGIRVVLGSTIEQAMVAIGASGVIAAAGGLLSGVALSFLAMRVLSSEIYGIRIYDPLTFIAAPLLLGIVALAATFLPTLRIRRIQPADCLRSE
jgi:predicted permease